MFDKLEEILAVPDKERRFHELEKCAADLGILSALEKRYGGAYNEQQLVIAIYDGYLAVRSDHQKSRRFILYVALGSLAACVLLFFVPKTVSNYLQLLKERQETKKKAYKGFDDKGKLVKDEKGQPVLFHDMDGYYEEYYDDGILHYDYLYSEGKVVEKKEYDREGKLLAHFIYDGDGNPILKQGE